LIESLHNKYEAAKKPIDLNKIISFYFPASLVLSAFNQLLSLDWHVPAITVQAYLLICSVF